MLLVTPASMIGSISGVVQITARESISLSLAISWDAFPNRRRR